MKVLLGRAMVCSHRLSVQTTVVSGTIWPQFVMQVLNVGLSVVGSRLVPWVARWWLPIGFHSNHRSLSPFSQCSDSLRTDRQTYRQNWSSKRRHYALKCIGLQKAGSMALLRFLNSAGWCTMKHSIAVVKREQDEAAAHRFIMSVVSVLTPSNP